MAAETTSEVHRRLAKELFRPTSMWAWLTPPRSLRFKLVVLCLGVALASAMVVSLLNYSHIARLSHNRAIEQLASETKLFAASFADAMANMKSDGYLLSSMPPIQGIVRASQAGDSVDPEDGSTTEQWRERLEVIFAHFLRERPHYTQARYIGMANNGRELVRVNRTNEGIKRVSPEQLQEKGREPYLARSTTMRPGDYLFSDVTLNRERGRTDEHGTPTLRLVVPVFEERETLFGFIVINADYPALLAHIFSTAPASHVMTIVDPAGDYMTGEPGSKQPTFHFRADPDYRPPIFLKSLHAIDFDPVVNHDHQIDYLVQIPIDEIGQRSSLFGVVATVNRQALFQNANASLWSNLKLSFVLVIMASLAGAVIGAELSKPLRQLALQIADRKNNTDVLQLPIKARDEIGELARAFQDMGNDLIRTTERATKSEEQLAAILETAPIGMMTLQRDGVIARANMQADAIFGYREQGLVGQHVNALVPAWHRDQHSRDIDAFFATGGKTDRVMAANREIFGVRQDGTEFHVEVALRRLHHSDRTMEVIASIQDVTERKKGEERLKSYAEALERSNQELDQFAYVASHDLKAPLRVIDNASKWLQEDLEAHLDDDSRENMDLLRGRVTRMEKLLDDLLDYSRIGRKTDQRYDELIAGDQLLDDILTLLAPPAGFEVAIGHGFSEINVRRMPLQQILLNLISNAIKHHDREGGKIDVSVEEHGDNYLFSVTDDGPGIPQKFHERVFKMFQTLKPRDQVEGSGMGLAMVQKQIETFGGTMTLHSDEGSGATFRFTWPKQQRIIQ